MKRWILAAIAAAWLLGACSGDPAPAAPGDGGAPAAELCVNSVCGERIVLLDLPSAENLTFSEDGRLFVSGGQGVYEISRDSAGTFTATPIAPDCGGGLGLAIVGQTLYAVCGQRIFAGALTESPLLTPAFEFADMCLPNGMAADPAGNLYVIDEPLQFCEPDPKIMRVNVDPADPMHLVDQEVWVQGSPAGLLAFGQDNVLRFPNGLQRRGDSFFGTDGGSIYRVDLEADGSAGEVQPLYFDATAHDDLGIAGNDLLVADFFGGRIFLLSQDGELLQETDRETFTSPSSVRLARGPMFQPGDILVTETGVLGDDDLPLDHLSVFRRRVQ